MLPTESAAFKIGYLFFSLDRSRSAADNPQKTGVIAEFCKKRGHGFITPDESPDRLFVHVSDVEGEYVPMAGDHVTYKECPIPPKRSKVQAVEVIITHLAPGTKHHRWEDPDG
ncbi:putative calcium-regulated heat stable protein 1-like isoform X2 [Apostichopus japonicus]|uniref:Putative calcium-regulated heat stable protein 1-like isoform X2 n=1 Tax=Stichopus japonicus TaxID=307972 RepID=A0A2G8KE39_STIJA|nr:putative calcium-regulated heat stable protein 1-like isoform X2 [Apostichopus japonicus]